MGPGTHVVPMTLHAEARARAVERLRQAGVPERAVVVLQGGNPIPRYDTDTEYLFRQESFFQYLFGVKEAGFYGILEVATGRATLFMPRLPDAWAVWLGTIYPPSHFEAAYGIENVRYVEELADTLRGLKPDVLLLLHGQNNDSGLFAQPATFPGIEGFKTDTAALYPELVECRFRKSAAEVELLRYVNAVSSAAHVAVMQRCKPGLGEYQLEAAFLHAIYDKGGCRFTAYTCICGCGPHSAFLHYGHQGAPDGRLQDGDTFLNDSGGEYHGYGADITCTYPVNGRFSEEQRGVYDTVLAANRAVQRVLRPGASWPDMHRLATRHIASGLRELGIAKGSVDELVANHVPGIFMPHGLGHLMGLDVHDPGGYPRGAERSSDPALKGLRCGRSVEAGVLITVEPGLYFIDAMLEPALADPAKARFLDAKVLERFRRVGGVRLEDDVLVTATGCENLTQVPREAGDIESVMAGARWTPPLPAGARA